MTKNELLRARISKVQREQYTVLCEHGELPAVVKGSFRKEAQEYPVIGDYVQIQYNPMGPSLIVSIEPRTSVFLRANLSGHAAAYAKTVKSQAMAANFDYVFIVTSLNQDFNLKRIARYVSTTLHGGAKPVVILTKSDLCSNPMEYIEKVQALSDQVVVHAVSAKTGEGMESLYQYFIDGTTIILLGSSGVGKSTLVNAVFGEEVMKVSAIRENDGRGRHTTTHREMFILSGVTIIDTPGIRELGMTEAEDGINETFSDIVELIGQCKFSNCSHRLEPGCAIQRAIENGSLSEARWQMYRKLQDETAWGRSKAAK